VAVAADLVTKAQLGTSVGAANTHSRRLGSARLGSARLGSARLGSARLGSALSRSEMLRDASLPASPANAHKKGPLSNSGACEPGRLWLSPA
jgi:hypothetical protein